MTNEQRYQLETLRELTALILQLQTQHAAIQACPEPDDSETMAELWHQHDMTLDDLFCTAETYQFTMTHTAAEHYQLIDAMRRRLPTTPSA